MFFLKDTPWLWATEVVEMQMRTFLIFGVSQHIYVTNCN